MFFGKLDFEIVVVYIMTKKIFYFLKYFYNSKIVF